jgi:hypothetical protein
VRREQVVAVAVGVLAGALVVLGTTLADGHSPSLPAKRTVTEYAPVPGPTVTRTVEVPVPGPTVTVAAREATPAPTRASRARTTALAAPAGFEAWLASPTRKRIIWRESHGICDITNPTGKYQGRYQMDDNFWRAYGGLKYAPNPHQATCHEQDLVAYRGWLARRWQPWGE